ncbi:putative ABC transporter permease protein YurN [Clostridia bacterium]|nr:putative ABC transporter permease protein YurN [Clostridia bacterium]
MSSIHKANRLNRTYTLAGVLFMLPALAIYAAFSIIPFFDSLVLSFSKWNGFSARQFIGIDNYITAFADKTFQLAIKNSVYLGVVSSLISVAAGVLFAWLLLYTGRRWGALFRTVLFSPSMIPSVITALIFAFVYEPDIGILNSIFRFAGLDFLQRAWLTNKATALNSILFVSIWKQVGLTMVLCFAGMQGINHSLIESARLDGASNIGIFRRIILPLTMPFIQLSAIFALMSGLKIYDTVVALTNGGPAKTTTVMPLWILQSSFNFNKYGYGAAMSMVFVIIVLIGMLAMKALFKGESYEQ